MTTALIGDLFTAPELLPVAMGNHFRSDVGYPQPVRMSGVSDNVVNLTSSGSYFVRIFSDFMPVVTSTPLFAPHYCQPITGLTTAFAIFPGIVGMFKAAAAFSRAMLRGDNEAKAVAAGDFSTSLALTGLGFNYLIQRVVLTRDFITQGPQARSALGSSLSLAGVLLLIILPVFSAVRNIYDIWKIRSLKKEINTQEKPFEYLYNKLNPTETALNEMSPQQKERLLQEALFYGLIHYKEKIVNLGGVVRESDDQIKKMFIETYGAEQLQLEILTLKNRQALSPICDADTIAQMEAIAESERRPMEMTEKRLDPKNQLIERINKVADTLLKKKGIDLLLNIASATLLTLSLIYTAGLPLFIIGAAIAVIELRSIILSAQALYTSLKNGEYSEDDHKVLKLSIATCLFSIALIATLTATAPAAAGLFATAPLILAGVITLGWLIISVAALRKSQANRRHQIEEQERRQVEERERKLAEKRLEEQRMVQNRERAEEEKADCA